MIKNSLLIAAVILLDLISITACTQANSLQKEASTNQIQSSIPTPSNLKPLNLGSYENIENQLKSFYKQGGISSVVNWTEQQWQPGR